MGEAVCLTHEYNPNVSEFGFLPNPKTGEGASVHAVQKLGYAVLNTAARRLTQEEVKLMHSTGRGERHPPHTHTHRAALQRGGKFALFLEGKLCLCISVIIKQFSTD